MEYKHNKMIVAKVASDALEPTESMKRYYLYIKSGEVTTQIVCDATTKGYAKKLAEVVIASQYPEGKLVLIEKLGSITKYYQK